MTESRLDGQHSRSIAIIGGGASGIATAEAILRDAPETDLHLFDPQIAGGRRGMGLAYGPDDTRPLLNAPLTYMSVRSHDPGHCERWFADRGHSSTGPPVTRPEFGLYLQSALDELTAPGGFVTPRRSLVRGVYETEDGFRLVSSQSELGSFDAVVLCTGWQAGLVPEGKTPLETLAADVRGMNQVTVLGCGLAALDAVRIILRESRAAVTMRSRRGVLPTVRQLAASAPLQVFTRDAVVAAPSFGLRDLFSGLVAEGVAAQVDLGPLVASADGRNARHLLQTGLDDQHTATWRGLVVRMSEEVMRPCWGRLEGREKSLFLRRFHFLSQSVCNPMSGVVAVELADAMDEGRLSVAASADAVRPSRSRGVMTVDCRRDGSSELADTTGPMVRSLLHQGLAVRDQFGGLVTHPTSNRLVTSGASRQLFAVGALTQGSAYIVNALDAIVRQASAVAVALPLVREEH